MKKRLGFLAMLVCVLALSLVFTACDNGTTSGDDSPYTQGRVTITFSSDYDGKAVYFSNTVGGPGGYTYVGAEKVPKKYANMATEVVLPKISGNKVTMKVWEVDSSGNLTDFGEQTKNFQVGLRFFDSTKPGSAGSLWIHDVDLSFVDGIGTGSD